MCTLSLICMQSSVTVAPCKHSHRVITCIFNENDVLLTTEAALVLYSAGDCRPVLDEIVRVNRVVDELLLTTRSDPEAILLLLLY